MDSLSGNQVKDLKDLYKSIYKVEESTEEAVGTPSSVEEENLLTELPKMGTLLPSQIKDKDKNKIDFSTNIAGTSIDKNLNKNTVDKDKNKVKPKMSNIPVIDGPVNNPNFGKKPEVNKVDTNKVDTNKVDTNKVDTSSGGGLNLKDMSKYSPTKDFDSNTFKSDTSKSVIKPEVKTKMNPIEVKNRARFGDARVDMLKAKNIDFKSMRKGDMTKDAFIKKYPKSITAQKASGLRDEYEPYDLVLDYVLSEGHADTVEEAHYVMTQMDTDTIQTIVEFIGGVKGDGYIGHPRLDIKNPLSPPKKNLKKTTGKDSDKGVQGLGNRATDIENMIKNIP